MKVKPKIKFKMFTISFKSSSVGNCSFSKRKQVDLNFVNVSDFISKKS